MSHLILSPSRNDSLRSTHSFALHYDMNYSIPGNVSSVSRPIQPGDQDTHARQLEAQIEALTLQNVKLQRTNRLLKIDTDNLVEKKTHPLKQLIRDLTQTNVKLQRATRLLQQELQDQTQRFNKLQQEQITHMRSIGPEYEYLVQMVGLLHRQIHGDATCKDTCCFTSESPAASSAALTINAKNTKIQHICRPVIHSTISQGSYASQLEDKIARLEKMVEDLDHEKQQLLQQHASQDDDVAMLKHELKLKDDIVSTLEMDFRQMEQQLEKLEKSNPKGQLSRPASLVDPRRQSQMLMETKRRSFAIKDPQLLEAMLRNDLGSNTYDPRSRGDPDWEDDMGKDTNMTTPPRSCSPTKDGDTALTADTNPSPDACEQDTLPCAFTTTMTTQRQDPHRTRRLALIFVFMTLLLALATALGITDDWTAPITLVLLVSGFLWTGGAKGVEVKLKLR